MEKRVFNKEELKYRFKKERKIRKKKQSQNTLPEILILFHANRFLMNKMKIELILIKNSPLNVEIWIITNQISFSKARNLWVEWKTQYPIYRSIFCIL